MAPMIEMQGHSYTFDDARGTAADLGDWWRQLTTGRDASLVEPTAWRTAAAVADAIGASAPVGDLETELDRLSVACWKTDDVERLTSALDAVLSGVDAMTAILRQAGEIASSGTGTVVQLSRSDGGVPKMPVETVEVGPRGVIGDRQASRRHHGKPVQALCLWSKEVIDDFVAQGHPLGYGSAGENVTISGLDWAEMRSGVRLRIGSVVAELTTFALPCTKNAQWFLGRDHTLMHHERGPVSRIYAWVREPGRIATGDAVIVV